jgi:hypothetical protein
MHANSSHPASWYTYFSVTGRLVCFDEVGSPNNLRPVWLDLLKFNKHCSTFVLFDKKFLILD